MACINGQSECVSALVEAGCDTSRLINVVEKTGLAYARRLGPWPFCCFFCLFSYLILCSLLTRGAPGAHESTLN